MPNWQKQLRNTFHTTPRWPSWELLSTYHSWMSESRPYRLEMETPADERLAQDLQYETTITAKKWRNTTVCSSHENSKWRWTEGLTTDWAFWESYAQALIGAIKRCDGGVSITMEMEKEFFNTAAYWLVNLLRLQLMDKHLMRIWCSSITWINIFISET